MAFSISFLDKMAAGGHFGLPKTFDLISRHFRSIRNMFYNLFPKMTAKIDLVFLFSPKSIGFFHYGSSMAVSNMNLIHELVSQLRETQTLACGVGSGDGV